MSHANALLAPKGRLKLASAIVDQGWPIRRAAERFQCSPATAKKWADRYRAGGAAAMVDRSSRPHYSPRRTPTRTERRIINLRFTRRWGPHRIAYHLHLVHSTVGAVYDASRCRCCDISIRTPDSRSAGRSRVATYTMRRAR